MGKNDAVYNEDELAAALIIYVKGIYYTFIVYRRNPFEWKTT